jgi:hypothetical protein
LSRLLHYLPVLALAHPEFLPHRLEWTTTNVHWRSRQVLAGHRRLFVLACGIRDMCIQMMFKFGCSTCIDYVCLQGCLPHHVQRGRQRCSCCDAIHGGSSSSSSSLDDQREFHKLIRGADEAHQCYSDETHEVSRLEHCLDAVNVALKASERETAAAKAVATDAQARIMGKGASLSCCPIHRLSFLIFLSSCCQRWRSNWWPPAMRRRKLASRRFS